MSWWPACYEGIHNSHTGIQTEGRPCLVDWKLPSNCPLACYSEPLASSNSPSCWLWCHCFFLYSRLPRQYNIHTLSNTSSKYMSTKLCSTSDCDLWGNSGRVGSAASQYIPVVRTKQEKFMLIHNFALEPDFKPTTNHNYRSHCKPWLDVDV